MVATAMRWWAVSKATVCLAPFINSRDCIVRMYSNTVIVVGIR